MTTETTSTTEAGRALKAKHRAMWAFGDYPAVATDLVSELGPVLAGACEIRPGDRVLDVAAGTGNAAIPAAEAGASVVASDLTPELLEAGQREMDSLPKARPDVAEGLATEKLGMLSPFDYDAMLKYEDFVGMYHRREPVRDNNRRARSRHARSLTRRRSHRPGIPLPKTQIVFPAQR